MIVVYDDAIPSDLNKYHQLLITGSLDKNQSALVTPEISFVMGTSPHVQATDNPNQHFLLFHEVVREGNVVSPVIDKVGSVVELCLNKAVGDGIIHPISSFYMTRVRIILDFPQKTNEKYGLVHYDSKGQLVILYYVTDAEGDTVFYDENGDVMQTVSPKAGRVVLFDSSLKHSAGFSKNEHRCVINYNILVDSNGEQN